MQEKFLLTERLKAARLEKAKVLLNLLKKKTPIILFTDEKYFTVDPVASSRTARYLTKGRARDVAHHIRVVQKTKHISQIMIFDLVTADGRNMNFVFLPQDGSKGASGDGPQASHVSSGPTSQRTTTTL